MAKSEAMKIVTPNHFAFFSKSIATGNIEHATTSPVKVKGNNYIKTIMYATGTGNKYAMTARFTYQLNGDQWHIKGGSNKYIFDEIWQKVE